MRTSHWLTRATAGTRCREEVSGEHENGVAGCAPQLGGLISTPGPTCRNLVAVSAGIYAWTETRGSRRITLTSVIP
jgi:hypothetical protein